MLSCVSLSLPYAIYLNKQRKTSLKVELELPPILLRYVPATAAASDNGLKAVRIRSNKRALGKFFYAYLM